ncbi:MAG: CatB-related O-acetyltransferase [Verrucomicrobiota bacterium]|jgi:acetyltransferase-like isoleucine patch superfamily enzyme
MNRCAIKFKKLLFILTPPRLRSRFSRDNPWLAKYQIGEWTYGYVKVLDWRSGSKLKIGRFCSIAGGVTIFLDNGEHHANWVATYPFQQFLGKPEHRNRTLLSTKGDVVIGNDVWIGNNVTILSGVCIGNGAIIGADSTVTRNVPAYSVAVGNPARVVKQRFTPEQVAALEQIGWWNWPVNKIREAMPLLMSPCMDEFVAKYSTMA